VVRALSSARNRRQARLDFIVLIESQLRFNLTLFCSGFLVRLRSDGIFAYGEPLSSDNPFWFASEELLTDLLRDEIHLVTQLLRNILLPEFY